MKKWSIFLTIFFFSIFVRTLKYVNMIRISNISFFRFCWKNGKLDWPKCARTVLLFGPRFISGKALQSWFTYEDSRENYFLMLFWFRSHGKTDLDSGPLADAMVQSTRSQEQTLPIELPLLLKIACISLKQVHI